MDRRRFLIGSAWAGLATGSGVLAAACNAVVVPPDSQAPSPTAPLPPTPTPITTPPPVDVTPAPSEPISGVSPVAVENRRIGTTRWLVDAASTVVSGYTDLASAATGDRLSLHVAADQPFDVEWYRLGWYGGAGGRLVRLDRGLPAQRDWQAVRDVATGRAEAPWSAALSVDVPPEWPSGMYSAVLRPPSGPSSYVPFIVRADGSARRAPVLFVSAATTWQAYNMWGGASFYDATSADSPDISKGKRAVQVSFDRPYAEDGGAGFQHRWELQFVRWQEREGRDVDYIADVDLELHPELLVGRRLIVFAGHHEYWSRPMRTSLDAAIAAGTNVAFLSANEIYWQVRLEPSLLGPARRITCYKSARLDPFATTQPSLTTCRWREAPVSEPEATVIGQMYGHIVRRPGDWVVMNANHWLYDGTGLRDGDRLVNLVGQEYDTFFPAFAHPGAVLLARGAIDSMPGDTSPGGLRGRPVHTATMYEAASGATVFSAGTFQWSWAIDEFGPRDYRGFATPYDERVVRMTRNLFDRLGDGPSPTVPGRAVGARSGHA